MTDPTTLEAQAIEFAKRGDFGVEALRVNETLTHLAPDNPGAWTRLARCCMEMGQLDGATAALDRALELNPQNTIARSLQGEVTKRRAGPAPAPAKRSAARGKSTGTRRPQPRVARSRTSAAPLAGFGRAEFAALGHLTPPAAAESLGSGIEALLVALNDRPFAAKIVEARNRAGHSGNWLFRRNTVHAGSAGHVYAFHYGGRWEPQINVGFFSAAHWQRNAVRAGIGFNFALEGPEANAEAGQERLLAAFEDFQRLVSTRWRELLTGWMGERAGFIQLGDHPPETDLRPAEAIDRLLDIRTPTEVGWVFCGRWLFLDRPDDAETLSDGVRLARWMEQAFSDLLPLWADVYRS